jgi:glycosyltransferase involved in cell wall biosynthesis
MPSLNNGIATYINFVKTIKEQDIEILANTKKLPPEHFRQYIAETITRKYGIDEIIIESPEAKASTLYIPSNYRVHIRLHCPLAIAQKYDTKDINQIEFSHELRVINKATIVSSPSYALAQELSDELNISKFYYYKNPIIDFFQQKEERKEKAIDIIFMGRFQELKGMSYINQILLRLPSEYKVLLMGSNSSAFKISPNVKCTVLKKEAILSEERFELVKSSKVLILLSKFENCSMTILEALSCHVPVVAWDVGGNKEIACSKVLSCAKFEDYDDFVNRILLFIKKPPGYEDFYSSLKSINEDFSSGFDSVVSSLKKPAQADGMNLYRGINFSETQQHHIAKHFNDIANDNTNKKIRVFGIAYSNEHVEELWAPIIDKLGYEYRYASRRPLGYHTVFKHSPYPINKSWYCVFDWIQNSDRLVNQIIQYKPNFILFHNGSHPSYTNVLNKIKLLNIPIIFSELGWFPQKDHVYFDKWGVNGKSYIASLSFEQLCNTKDSQNKSKKLSGDYALIALQLENDTNIIIGSPRFKSNDRLIQYILSEIGDKTKIVIKPHPLDKTKDRYTKYESEQVSVVFDVPIDLLLAKAHSIIAINSTVLLQALDYDVNIYAFGFSILDNKGILIDCIHNNISDMWATNLVGSKKKRILIKKELECRQINLLKVRDSESIMSCVSQIALQPLIAYRCFNFSTLIGIGISNGAIPTKNISAKTDKNKQVHKGIFTRKLNKFRRTPMLFLKDMKNNIITKFKKGFLSYGFRNKTNTNIR